ncbi:MAG: 2-hydroxyacyl-CoA dehydratase [Deltaproteobacteria bacterium]|nr:2-hydroxyacyl-CoA dehydratase [Deltaproteobacteria bacterium]
MRRFHLGTLGNQLGDSVKHKSRILLTGRPTINQKVLDGIENGGGIVTAMENCGIPYL